MYKLDNIIPPLLPIKIDRFCNLHHNQISDFLLAEAYLYSLRQLSRHSFRHETILSYRPIHKNTHSQYF